MLKHAILASFGVALLAGCSGGKKEAATMVAAIDKCRVAGYDEVQSASDALALVPCSRPDICAVKETCVTASRLLAKSVAVHEAYSALAAKRARGETVTRDDPSFALIRSERDPEGEAKEEAAAGARCATQERVLRRKYDL
jgi:hypothetical protein